MSTLQLAAGLNFAAALLHIGVILGGPSWYRFFGAGEQMAHMAEQKKLLPALLTFFIAGVLAVWGLYCLALDNRFPALPWTDTIMLLVTAVYLIRALYPLLLSPWVAIFRQPFMVWSSLICAGFGAVHLLGVWPLLS